VVFKIGIKISALVPNNDARRMCRLCLQSGVSAQACLILKIELHREHHFHKKSPKVGIVCRSGVSGQVNGVRKVININFGTIRPQVTPRDPSRSVACELGVTGLSI
jgi:hypothetical protein